MDSNGHRSENVRPAGMGWSPFRTLQVPRRAGEESRTIAVLVLFMALCACGEMEVEGPQGGGEVAAYAGAAACAGCHSEVYQAWHGSLHRRSMQVPSPTTVKGDFTKNNVYTYGGLTSRMFVRNGDYFIETDGPDGERATYRVDYLIGDRDTQWYLTTLPGGRIQVLPAYYDIREGTWYDPVEGLFDRPEGFTPGEVNYWTNFGRNWNFQCFDCHASQIEKNFDPGTGTYDTRWQDLSINCETCHGPGSRHASFWKSLPNQTAARDTTLVNLKFLSPEQSVEVCAQCHMDKRIIGAGYHPGDPFYDFYEPELLDSEKFWPDGRYRALNYNTLAFMLSACYTVGRLSCTGCHESHHLGPVKGQGETRAASYEQICLDCHRLDVGQDLEQHSRHKTVGCIGCHMPVVDEVKRIGVYDHRIASPVPANTDGFGIPNACNGCHDDRPVAWATEWVTKWWGPQDEKVAVTRAIALGRTGDPEALEGLTAILSDPVQSPVLRASAAVLLGRQTDSRAQAALIEALKDGHPLVRSRAVEGLMGLGAGAEGLVRLLDDPSKLVRMRAAAALEGLEADEVRPRLLAALAEYREMVTGLLADDPEAQVQAGIEALQRGEERAGEAAFQQALKVWTGMADAYAGLGTVFVRGKQYRDAVEMWQEAVGRDSTLIAPLHRACELWEADIRVRLEARPVRAQDYNDLGDTYAIRDSLDLAIHWYRKAVELDARHAVSYRNLALVCAEAGRAQEAEEALDGYRRLTRNLGEVQKLKILIRKRRRTP